MLSLVLVLAVSVLFTLVLEWFFWRMFRRKIDGLHFPRGADSSFFRFFSLGRIRACAIIHTAFLLAVTSLILILLW